MLKSRVLVAAAAGLVTLGAPAVAFAAQWNNISGTSTTTNQNESFVRSVTTCPSVNVLAKMTTIPAGGIKLQLGDNKNNNIPFTNQVTINDANQHTLATSVLCGTKFVLWHQSVSVTGSYVGQLFY